MFTGAMDRSNPNWMYFSSPVQQEGPLPPPPRINCSQVQVRIASFPAAHIAAADCEIGIMFY